MKAILLAAGLGTRLRPITDTIPKCLVPINGRPLLGWWFDLLEEHGITEVWINLHYLPEKVREFLGGESRKLQVHLIDEEQLLGSGGTLHANRGIFADAEQFYILYADNLTNANLTALRQFNQRHPSPLTVGLFRAENPSACGIASLDSSGTIISFEEKPENPKGDLASAGIFIARPKLFEYLRPEFYPYDFGGHVMPHLVGRMNGMPIEGYIRDIGTLESLERAEREWGEVRRVGSS
ncbi:MAG: nucleotidyltransferase family protein [Ignavibacteriae bacterium]|nr:nucleotidyltransferase family protein [Ignavibacteriota bacterium]MCB9217334.1 nucleotidyltransferase family protein [Ignavibacteria bacterium]